MNETTIVDFAEPVELELIFHQPDHGLARMEVGLTIEELVRFNWWEIAHGGWGDA